ncbi:uncharacterized protein KY384_002134 [Bacidia gigantensis]|uniref:uncharacterized protein n=1 Tax=Bacidia gigantensis TaxID=2732470 RepID=UPI001D04323A|nr:uncharacterized protein KY384_002134 [Bacidia gigantensis]KAG8533351.1 hypothetical protein KY384_002134 [Bacidia gigantensis]
MCHQCMNQCQTHRSFDWRGGYLLESPPANTPKTPKKTVPGNKPSVEKALSGPCEKTDPTNASQRDSRSQLSQHNRRQRQQHTSELEEGQIDNSGEKLDEPCTNCVQCRLHGDQVHFKCPNEVPGRRSWGALEDGDESVLSTKQPVSDLVTNITALCFEKHTRRQHIFGRRLYQRLLFEQSQWEHGKPRLSTKDLHDFFVLFDKTFFRGLLTNSQRVNLEVVTEDAGEGEWLGHTVVSDKLSSNTQATIRVRKLRRKDFNPRHILQCLLETLLHEMVHAVLELFACCCRVCFCKRNLLATVGLRGHGPTWIRLGKALQDTLNRNLPNVMFFPWTIYCAPSELALELDLKRRIEETGECEGKLDLPLREQLDEDDIARLKALRLG